MTAKHIQASNLIAKGIFDGLKNFHEFEKKVSSLFELNTKVQGDAFEVFVEAYLATQPIIQCQESWPVGFISSEIREALNLPNDSKGIDGVYKSALDVSKTEAGRQRCAEAKTIHGRETREARTERSLASARLAVLEAVSHKLGFMNGGRTRGVRPQKMDQVLPELQEIVRRIPIKKLRLCKQVEKHNLNQ